jgi:hypothetical protein
MNEMFQTNVPGTAKANEGRFSSRLGYHSRWLFDHSFAHGGNLLFHF